MNVQGTRTKILLIGCNYPSFQIFWRVFANSPDINIVGYVYVEADDEPPVHQFKGNGRLSIVVYPCSKLEKVIAKQKVAKCIILSQNITMARLESVIHRIISVGSCSIEFMSPSQAEVYSFKPTICITSLSKQAGKTQMGRYCTIVLNKNTRKVAVIIPVIDLRIFENPKNVLKLERSPHFEFTSFDEVPKNFFSQDTVWQIDNYFKCGAFRVYVTSDVRRALIQAEQYSDIIVYDSCQCEVPFIKTNSKICVTAPDVLLKDVRSKCLWPGLVNLNRDHQIAVVTQGYPSISEKVKQMINSILKDKRTYFVKSITTLDNSSGFEIFNRKVLTIGHEETKYEGKKVAVSMGASEVIDPSPFLTTGLETSTDCNAIIASFPHASSPTAETEAETEQTMVKIAQTVNRSDADVLIVSLPNDIPGIDPSIQVLYTSPEIVEDETDCDSEELDLASYSSTSTFNSSSNFNSSASGINSSSVSITSSSGIQSEPKSIYGWLSKFFISAQKPPLQTHFEAQVDILLSMAESTDKELYVTNNTSANREALCRLFLSSHLPSGFRVTTGEIIDASGNHSSQLGVIIVNDSGPLMTIDNTSSVIAPILADSVLAVLEVKTSMTCETLKKSLSQLRTVKALMPMHGTLESPDGHIIEDPLGGKIITGVFAFNPSNEIDSKVPDIIKLYPFVADFIVLLDAFGYFSVETLKVCGFKVKEEDVKFGYVRYSARGMGLALIFGILNSIAATRRFSGSNCIRYLSGNWGDLNNFTE
ncbi:hypothetical protein TRFO_36367 [Tritrichomonas foetus]|uniref:DUF6602 domain-containing protein n=1 Tax=Tritrichomonas foetus TaxID=1144522 RepID=A0A1J4JFE6_9EUKA|nr:hypothetical protein TRFO_36367 [Tritrichomonas foetus]|eukprot:OHS97393.1 hypothetical protein TRFO_36367 [Tritrichomonas foetus]